MLATTFFFANSTGLEDGLDLGLMIPAVNNFNIQLLCLFFWLCPYVYGFTLTEDVPDTKWWVTMNKQPMSIEISLAIVSSGSMNGGCTRERKSWVEFSSYFLVIPILCSPLVLYEHQNSSWKKNKSKPKRKQRVEAITFVATLRSSVVIGFLLAANCLLMLFIAINLFKLYYGDTMVTFLML